MASSACGRVDVAADDVVPGRDEVPRHRQPHRAEPDEGDSQGVACELAAERRAAATAAGRSSRERDPDHDLVRARRVGDPHLEGLVVRADAVIVLVLDRDVDRRTGGATLLRGREQRRTVDRLAHPVAEAQVVDDRRAVLDLAVEADERALAVALDLAAEQLERALGQQRPERLAVLVDQRLEILDVAPGERVRDHGAGSDHPHRRIDRAAPLLVDVLDDGDDLPQPLHRPRIIRLPVGEIDDVLQRPARATPARAASRCARTCPATTRSRSRTRRSRRARARCGTSGRSTCATSRSRSRSAPGGRSCRTTARPRTTTRPSTACARPTAGSPRRSSRRCSSTARVVGIVSLHQLGSPRDWTEAEIEACSAVASARRGARSDPQPLASRPRADRGGRSPATSCRLETEEGLAGQLTREQHPRGRAPLQPRARPSADGARST